MKKILIILIAVCSLFISCEKEEIVVDEHTFIEEPTTGGEFLYENEFEWVYKSVGYTYIDSLNIYIASNLKAGYPRIGNCYPQTKDYNSLNAENIDTIPPYNGACQLYENAVFANIYNEKVYIYKLSERSETEYIISGIYKCFNEIK